MKLWCWIVPVVTGAVCGWLGARVSNQGNAEPGAAVRVLARQTVTPVAPVPASAPENTALETAERNLQAAEQLLWRISVAPVEQLTALSEEIARLPRYEVPTLLARAALCRRWLETGVERALAGMQAKDPFREELLSEWMRESPRAALAWATQAGMPRMNFFYNEYPETSEQILAAYFEGSSASGTAPLRLLEGLVQSDPAAALALLDKLPAGDARRDEAIRTIAGGMAAADPAAAVAWLRGSGFAGKMDSAVVELLNRSAYANPQLVRGMLEASGLSGEALSDLRTTVAAGLAGKDTAALLDFLKDLPDGSLQARRGPYMPESIKAASLSLADLATLTSEMTRAGMDPATVRYDWSGMDPGKQLLQLAALPEGPVRDRLAKSLSEAALVGGTGVTPLEVAALPESVRSQFARQKATAALATNDRAQAGEWLALAAPGDVAELLANGRNGWFHHGDGLEFQLLERVPAEDRSRCVNGLASALAQTEPQQAIAWAETLRGADQRHAWAGIAASMAQADEAQAALWVQALPDTPARDGAVQSLTGRLVRSDPEAALQWALTIREDTARRASLATLVDVWADRDLPEASRHVLEAGLTDADRAAMEAMIEQRGGGQ